jgi:hypothetical protein
MIDSPVPGSPESDDLSRYACDNGQAQPQRFTGFQLLGWRSRPGSTPSGWTTHSEATHLLAVTATRVNEGAA